MLMVKISDKIYLASNMIIKQFLMLNKRSVRQFFPPNILQI